MKIEWKQCFKVGISVFILFLCIHYWSAVGNLIGVFFSGIIPILIGCALAYLVNIFMCGMEKRYFPNTTNSKLIKSKRPVCMIGAILLGIETFINAMPDLIDDISGNKYIQKIVSKETLSKLEGMKWESYASKISGFMFSGIGGAVNTVASVASSVISIIVTIVLGIIFSIYFLTGKEELIGRTKRVMSVVLKDKLYEKVMHYFNVFDECFHGYIIGKLIDAFVLGLMCIVVMLICRFPYAVMIGTLIGFSALIPVVGAYVGTAVGALMVLTESPMKALAFLIIILIVQLIEANVIYPKIMGNSIGLPGIWVLAAVTLGGSLFGIVGMLIGVPILAGFYKLAGEGVRKRERKMESDPKIKK